MKRLFFPLILSVMITACHDENRNRRRKFKPSLINLSLIVWMTIQILTPSKLMVVLY